MLDILPDFTFSLRVIIQGDEDGAFKSTKQMASQSLHIQSRLLISESFNRFSSGDHHQCSDVLMIRNVQLVSQRLKDLIEQAISLNPSILCSYEYPERFFALDLSPSNYIDWVVFQNDPRENFRNYTLPDMDDNPIKSVPKSAVPQMATWGWPQKWVTHDKSTMLKSSTETKMFTACCKKLFFFSW